MSQTRADLDAALTALQTKANTTLANAGDTQAAVQDAANRVAALPPSNDDFQAEVNQIGAISDTLDQANTIIGATKAIANQILPPP